jgi:hypothetical protein
MISFIINKELNVFSKYSNSKKFSSKVGSSSLKLLEPQNFYYKTQLKQGHGDYWFRTLGDQNRNFLHESQKFKYIPILGNFFSNAPLALNYRNSFSLKSGLTIDSLNKKKLLKSIIEESKLRKSFLASRSAKAFPSFTQFSKLTKNGAAFRFGDFFDNNIFVPKRKKRNFGRDAKLKFSKNSRLKINYIRSFSLEKPRVINKILLNIFKVRLKFIKKRNRYGIKNQNKPFFIRFNKRASQILYKQFFLKNVFLFTFKSIKTVKNKQSFNSEMFSFKTKKLIKNLS